MKMIGLIGGVASGKSTVARQLKELGAIIIDMDKVAHEVLNFQEIIDLMNLRWKDRGFQVEQVGMEERHQIAQIVFNDYSELDFLESITWPPMYRILQQKLQLYHASNTGCLVLDFPLLIESKMDKDCDEIWFVDCPKEQRFVNFRNRRKMYGETEKESRQTFESREQRQKSLKEKSDRADVIIHNDMGESVKQEVQNAWSNEKNRLRINWNKTR